MGEICVRHYALLVFAAREKTRWHVTSACKKNGDPIQNRYAKRRKTITDKLKIAPKTLSALLTILSLTNPHWSRVPTTEDGCYPHWSRTSAGRYVYKLTSKQKVVKHTEKRAGSIFLGSLVSLPSQEPYAQALGKNTQKTLPQLVACGGDFGNWEPRERFDNERKRRHDALIGSVPNSRRPNRKG